MNLEEPSAALRFARAFLLALGAATAAVTALDLVLIRHWDSPVQLVVWPAVAGWPSPPA